MECRIEVKSRKGKTFVAAGSYPKGHARNPMSEAEIEAKFRKLCAGRVAEERRDALMKAVWSLQEERDVGDLTGLIVLDNH